MLQNSFSIIQIEISSLALSKHVEIQPEPFSSIERDLWRYALRVNRSIRRFQSLSIEENFQSSALRNELQTLENTPAEKPLLFHNSSKKPVTSLRILAKRISSTQIMMKNRLCKMYSKCRS